MLRIVHGDFSMVFTGDAEGETELSAMANFPAPGALRTTLVTGSHHGAWTKDSNDYPWAVATRPRMLVFSAGHNFSHPRCEALNAFEPYTVWALPHVIRCGASGQYQEAFKSQRAEYVTKTNGTVVVTTNGQSAADVYCSGEWPCTGRVFY